MAGSEIRNLGSAKTTLDGTEIVPIQEAAGGANSTKHTTTSVMAQGLVFGEATLTETDLASVHTTPVTVLSAPGSGLTWFPVAGYAACKPTSGAWCWGSSTTHGPKLYFGTATSGSAFGVFPCDTFSGQASGNDYVTTFFTFPELLTSNFTAGINQPINIGISSGTVISLNAVTAITLGSGGTGYAVNDTGSITCDFFGLGATYIVTSVSGGVVTGVSLTAGGTFYSTAHNPRPTTTSGGQPGSGTGLTLNVTSVTASTGTLKVGLYARAITLPT